MESCRTFCKEAVLQTDSLASGPEWLLGHSYILLDSVGISGDDEMLAWDYKEEGGRVGVNSRKDGGINIY
jgi:hypothetical protein